MSKGKEISYYTRWFSTVWMDEVAALYSVFGIRYRARFRNAFSFLSLSLSHPGNKRFEHFSDNDIQAFRANYPNTRFKNVLRSSPVIELPVLSSKLQNILHDQRA